MNDTRRYSRRRRKPRATGNGCVTRPVPTNEHPAVAFDRKANEKLPNPEDARKWALANAANPMARYKDAPSSLAWLELLSLRHHDTRLPDVERHALATQLQADDSAERIRGETSLFAVEWRARFGKQMSTKLAKVVRVELCKIAKRW